MDIDDEKRHHHDILLLFRAEREMLADENHLENIDEIPHPPGVVCGVQPLRHFELTSLPGEKL